MARSREPEGPPRKPRGRPFRQGFDERRHAGRAPNPMTAALREVMDESPEDMKEAWRVAFQFAKAGNIPALLAIAAYSDGKPVARQEQGGPGDFGRPDFSDFTSEELREFIRAVRKDDEQEGGSA
jgi:hypothetical protein